MPKAAEPQRSALGRIPDQLRSGFEIMMLALVLVLAPGSPALASGLEEPCTGTHDWVRLTSSEWLKGDLRQMRSREIHFWSREMKSRRMKWSKVAVLCMGGEARFVTEANAIFAGMGVVKNDRVFVDRADGKISFPRADLMAILPGKERERDRWGVRIGLGVDANQGNTEQVAVNTSMSIRRESGKTRAEIAYSGTVGTAAGQENINRHRVDTGANWFVSKRFYWAVLNMPLMYDKFQNIGARLAPSTGPGWQIFDGADFEWSVEAALGYQYTSFISVSPPQAPEASDAVIRLSTDLKWDIIEDLEFILNHDTAIVPTDAGLTTLRTRVGLKYEITWLLKLETVLVHNRIWEPVPLEDGRLPEPDDVQLIVGFNFETY